MADERIFEDTEFVEAVLTASQEHLERKYALAARGVSLDDVAEKAAELIKIKSSELWLPGKERKRVQARSLLCYWATTELGVSMAELSRRLQQSKAAVSLSVKRGEKLTKQNHFSLNK